MADKTELENLDDLEHEVEFLLRNNPANGLDELALVPDYEQSITELFNLVKQISKNVRQLGTKDDGTLGAGVLDGWKGKLLNFESQMNLYRREVKRRALDLKNSQDTPQPQPTLASTQVLNNSTSSSVEQERLEFEKEQLQQRKKLAEFAAKSSLEATKKDIEDLTRDFTEHLDWMEAKDSEVEKAMGNIKSWRKRLTDSRKEVLELEGKILGGDIGNLTNEMSRLKVTVQKAETELDAAISAIKEADEAKGIFAERAAKTSPVQLPTFSGLPNEDFIEFQTEFEKGVIENKIPKTDQVKKLLEVLKGKAKAQVPVKTDTLERAWELLNSAFGDPMILLRHRKQSLQKLGDYPENMSRTNPQKIVEWCLNVEKILSDLVKLGERSSRLEMIAFNDDTINGIIDMFPTRLLFRMERLDLEGKEKLEGVIEIIEEERKVLQKVANRSAGSKKVPRTNGTADPPSKHTPKVNMTQPKSFTFFNTPKKLSTCRICQELEKRGDNKDLYENHHGNYATHDH